MIREAIILAGGLGTRLRSVIDQIPKPMAPVSDRPFLDYLVLYLKKFNVERIILSVGYKHEPIYDYFGIKFKEIEIEYAVEDEPLGTGGGIKNALLYARNSNLFLLNGDSFFNVDLEKLEKFHTVNSDQVSLSLKKMKNFDRYGTVTVHNNRIEKFESKKYCKEGYINGGVYLIECDIFKSLPLEKKFSFENDFLHVYPDKIYMGAYKSESYFIDIGIPEDYNRAQMELPELFQG